MSEAWGVTLDEWNTIVDRSELTVSGISRRFDIAYSSVKGWLSGDVIPKDKSVARMRPVITALMDMPRIPYHSSYGYATQEQIAKLAQPIKPSERSDILTQIEKQTRLEGKID